MCSNPSLVALFTDFGVGSHYIGQVKARLLGDGVKQPIIELCSDAPVFDPFSSAYLLASFIGWLPADSLIVAVVDPGVGSNRLSLLAKLDNVWVIAPDNGLLSVAMQRSSFVSVQTIEFAPEKRSRTFDGRDLFAPVAARLCKSLSIPGESTTSDLLVGHDWPSHLFAIIYLDHYGNAVSGLFGDMINTNQKILACGVEVPFAETFSAVKRGDLFWYVNSNNLVEIAANCTRVDEQLLLEIGTPIEILS